MRQYRIETAASILVLRRLRCSGTRQGVMRRALPASRAPDGRLHRIVLLGDDGTLYAWPSQPV